MMDLTVFHAAEGDCLLLSEGGRNLLIDGGRASSFVENTLPGLDKIDLLVVSHVDRDHIEGILTLVDRIIAWAVFEYQTAQGLDVDPPAFPKPPSVPQIWHNSYPSILQELTIDVQNATAVLSDRFEAALASGRRGLPTDLRRWADDLRDVAASVTQGIRLTQLIGPQNLTIPQNAPFAGNYAELTLAPISLGDMEIRVLGPTTKTLRELKSRWKKWLEAHTEASRRAGAEVHEELQLASGQASLRSVVAASEAHSVSLARVIEADFASRLEANKNARRSGVTEQNLSSITMLVTHGRSSVLLTGDAHQDDILDGLRAHGLLVDGAPFHCTVLKVQHHGSEFNLDVDFADLVTADTYVFCSDGAHHNPDRSVVKAIIDRRLRDGTDRQFTLAFNSSATRPGVPDDNAAHIGDVLAYARNRAAKSNGRIDVEMLEDSDRALMYRLPKSARRRTS